jgi:ribosomal protein L14
VIVNASVLARAVLVPVRAVMLVLHAVVVRTGSRARRINGDCLRDDLLHSDSDLTRLS